MRDNAGKGGTIPKRGTIRPAVAEDMSTLLDLIEAAGLFPPGEVEELREMLTDYFNGKSGSDHFWVVDEGEADGSGLAAVAYYAPERMTCGTWNLYLIAVRPEHRGQGRGAMLLEYVEQTLAMRGERLLIVETSGLDDFERTRRFYRRQGYVHPGFLQSRRRQDRLLEGAARLHDVRNHDVSSVCGARRRRFGGLLIGKQARRWGCGGHCGGRGR